MSNHWCYICNQMVSINNNTCNICNQSFIMESNMSPFMMMIAEIIDQRRLDMVMQRSLEESQENPNRQKTSDNFINQLEEISIVDDKLNIECSICKDTFVDEPKGVVLSCGYMYHKDCLTGWLKVDHHCPVCRFELPTEEESDV